VESAQSENNAEKELARNRFPSEQEGKRKQEDRQRRTLTKRSPLLMWLGLLLLAGEPPLKVFFPKLLPFVFLGLDSAPQAVTHLDELLSRDRQPAAPAHVVFCQAYVAHLASAFGTVSHAFTPAVAR